MNSAWPTLNDFYSQLLQRVFATDFEEQLTYLSVVADTRHIPVEWLVEQGIFFIPNNDYVTYHMGVGAKDPDYGFYLNGDCIWNQFVVIPVRDLANKVVGLTGWDAKNKYLVEYKGEVGLPMYKVSGKYLFNREDRFLTIPTLLRDKFSCGTIFLVDGVFDCLSLCQKGVPTIAMLGSTLSGTVAYFLRWYRKVYVVKDNDDAGNKLLQRVRAMVPSVRAVIQSKTKDIEEYLRDDTLSNHAISVFEKVMASEVDLGDIVL